MKVIQKMKKKVTWSKKIVRVIRRLSHSNPKVNQLKLKYQARRLGKFQRGKKNNLNNLLKKLQNKKMKNRRLKKMQGISKPNHNNFRKSSKWKQKLRMHRLQRIQKVKLLDLILPLKNKMKQRHRIRKL